MKNLIWILLFSMAAVETTAQTMAITESGDEVLLYDDGTWEFANATDSASYEEIPLSEVAYEKPKKATFLVKSKKLPIGVYMTPKEWSFEKGAESDATEYQFKKKGEDLYGMLITEKIEIPLETLKQIAIQNAKSVAPDISLVHQEYRMVNGIKVLQMQLKGTIQGIKFAYYGYYYSDSNGTCQFVAYTSENLLSIYQDDIEGLLNGLTLIEE